MNKKIIISLFFVGLLFVFIQVSLKAQTPELSNTRHTPESPLYFINQQGEEIQGFFTFSDQVKPHLRVSLIGDRVSGIKVMLNREVPNNEITQVAFVKTEAYMNEESGILEKLKVRVDIIPLEKESFETLTDIERGTAQKINDINFIQEIENVLKKIADEPVNEVFEENFESDPASVFTEEEIILSDEKKIPIGLISEPESVFISAPAEEETLQVNEAEISIESTQKTETETELKSESEPTSVLVPEALSQELIEVLYTFDGVVWKSLGFVEKDAFTDASFKIPIEKVLTGEDLSKIQIGIRSILTLNNATPTIYLDSVWTEVEYQKIWEYLHTFPEKKEGDIILSEVQYENMVAVLVSRKPNTLISSPKKELWLASFIAPVLDDVSTTTSTTMSPAMKKTNWQKIADDSLLAENPRLLFSNGNVFWVGKDDTALWRFNPQSNGYDSVSLFQGEPTRLYFEDQAGEENVLEMSFGELQVLDAPASIDENVLINEN